MGGLFSKPKGNKVTEVDRAILSLKTQRRKLLEYQKKLEAVIARETEVARQLVKERKKDRAVLTLKKRKSQEQMLERVDTWLLTVEDQISNIDTAARQKEVFESLKKGHNVIKELQSEISIEEVQKLMDDSAEAKAYQEEVNKVLGQKLTDEDEEDVLLEFEKLEDELLAAELPPVPLKPEERLEEEEEGMPAEAAKGEAKPVAQLELGVSLRSKPVESKGEAATDAAENGELGLDLPDVPTAPVHVKLDEPSVPLKGKIALKEDPMLA